VVNLSISMISLNEVRVLARLPPRSKAFLPDHEVPLRP
jgi:hypothetical protein